MFSLSGVCQNTSMICSNHTFVFVDETVDVVRFDFPNVVGVLGLPTGVGLSVTKRFSNKLWLEQPQ